MLRLFVLFLPSGCCMNKTDSSSRDGNEHEPELVAGRDYPAWFTPELIENAMRVGRRRYGPTLTLSEGIEMLVNLNRLFDLLEDTP